MALSCVGVDYTEVDNSETTGVLELLQVGLPSDLDEAYVSNVALSRVMNTIHYTCNLADTNRLTVERGSYLMTAITYPEDEYRIDKYDEFGVDKSVAIRELCVEYLPLEPAVAKAKCDELNIIYNSGIKYVGSLRDIYAAVSEFSQSARDTIKQNLRMSNIIQTVILKLNVYVGDGVNIDFINGTLTGLADNHYLVSGLINYDDLTAAVFECKQVSISGNHLVYQASFRCFGLFSAALNTLVSGPGILRLAIGASCLTEDGDTASCLFQAGLNLKTDIDLAASLKETDDGFVQNKSRVSVNVSSDIRINRSNIISETDTGIEGWFDASESVDVEM